MDYGSFLPYQTDVLEQISRGKKMRQIMLTFDVDDFINDRSMKALYRILELLQEYDILGLFFVTGHVAEKLGHYPHIIDLLKSHEIGFHSSSHSVRPTIFEYCDLEDYDKAYEVSLLRENSHINPLTGEIEGIGGITSLRELFSNKNIVCFRAPGVCWTPPNLEALAALGISHDFSSFVCSRPVLFKKITFYPYPNFFRPERRLASRVFLRSLRRSLTVVTFHPDAFANEFPWDCIFYKGNPSKLSGVPSISYDKEKLVFLEFEKLLKQLRLFRRTGQLQTLSGLEKASEKLEKGKIDVDRCYEKSVNWPITYFDFTPKFLRYHFSRYFGSGDH
jgi:hypothetical protein